MASLSICPEARNKEEHDLLNTSFKTLQRKYKVVLESASENIHSTDLSAIVDEIGVFWLKNRALVDCILRYLHEPYSTHIFTAATILDINDLEHYPFVSLGRQHLWDDPIFMYGKVTERENGVFGEKLQEQFIRTLDDNIRILSQAENIIQILPIRFFLEPNERVIHEAAQQCFFSLFRENMNFDSYNKSIHTISQVKEALIAGMEENIYFCEEEDHRLSFEMRFEKYKKSTILPLPSGSTDGKVFWFTLYGYITQALIITTMCMEYKLIPHIRSPLAFKYFLLLAPNFGDDEIVRTITHKAVTAHVLHHSFDKSQIEDINFAQYYKVVKDYDIEDHLGQELGTKDISIEALSFHTVKAHIDRQLNAVIAMCRGTE